MIIFFYILAVDLQIRYFHSIPGILRNEKMDVLNLKKRLTSQTSPETMCGGLIKMEPDDELDKENCEDEDYVTDLTMADSVRNIDPEG